MLLILDLTCALSSFVLLTNYSGFIVIGSVGGMVVTLH